MDEPHVYVKRRVTADRTPALERHLRTEAWGEPPCDLCGGSRRHPIHVERPARRIGLRTALRLIAEYNAGR